MRNRENGRKVLELAGFVLEKEGDEEYYSMKEGNLNVPWISYVENEIDEVLEGEKKKKKKTKKEAAGKQANAAKRRSERSQGGEERKEGEDSEENLSYE